MKLTFADIQRLGQSLPSFSDPRAIATVWLQSRPVQTYLDHYHINFSREFETIQHRFGGIASQGYRIAMHLWQQPEAKGTVFVLHGYTDNTGLMQHLIRFLLQQQWDVVCFDLPGHGLSSGKRATIDNFDTYRDVFFDVLQHLDGKAIAPLRGIGQSTGGAILLNYLCSYPGQTAIKQSLLLAPLVRSHGWAWQSWFLPFLDVFTSKIKRGFLGSSHDVGFLSFIEHHDPCQPDYLSVEWLKAMQAWVVKVLDLSTQWQPLTIIQGDKDTTVDWRYNVRKIQKVFPETHIKLIEGARHQLVNESDDYRAQVMALIGEWLTE